MEIMDVVTAEETTEIVEPVAEVAKSIDWAKYGKIAGGVALVVASVYGACKLVPMAVESFKTWNADQADRKKAKDIKGMVMVNAVEVNDVENENDK